MLYGVTVRNPAARGRIRAITFEDGLPWDEVTIVTADDIPCENCVALLLHDQPLLAKDSVQHAEEPVLLLAHPDRYLLEEARRRVRIDVDPLPGVYTIEDALACKEVIWGEDNIFKKFHVKKGDIEQGFRDADLIVEGEYFTGAQEQLYIENNGVIAIANPDEITVWGSMQCPYYIHKALLPIFGLPPDKIRVIQMDTGGGFGGKEEYPSMIAGHAALLAQKSRKPVKLIYDRAEDLVATTKRHPSRTRHRTGVTRDGKLVAIDIEFDIDGGAYCTLSPVVLSRGTIHAAGPYICPNVSVRSRAVATSVPPHGAFRGFGAPQSIFALERQMDKVANALGLAPEEFRRRNFLHEGETTATGQLIREKTDLPGLFEASADARELRRVARAVRTRECAQHQETWSRVRNLHARRGIHRFGRSDARKSCRSGSHARRRDSDSCREHRNRAGYQHDLFPNRGRYSGHRLRPDWACSAGHGDGSEQRADRRVAHLHGGGQTCRSRLRRTQAKLCFRAACSASLTRKNNFPRLRHAHVETLGALRAMSEYQPPPGVFWNDETYQGDAYGAFAWAVYVAVVTVDPVTYEVRVDDFVALQEVGKVIHPVLAAGQIEGGVAQAIGYALYEDVVWKNGKMANAQMTNYIMPTAADLPPIRVFFEENPYAYGPSGAKGIGELPMDGVAPAILNAVEHATGVAVNQIPLTPERVLEAVLD